MPAKNGSYSQKNIKIYKSYTFSYYFLFGADSIKERMRFVWSNVSHSLARFEVFHKIISKFIVPNRKRQKNHTHEKAYRKKSVQRTARQWNRKNSCRIDEHLLNIFRCVCLAGSVPLTQISNDIVFFVGCYHSSLDAPSAAYAKSTPRFVAICT